MLKYLLCNTRTTVVVACALQVVNTVRGNVLSIKRLARKGGTRVEMQYLNFVLNDAPAQRSKDYFQATKAETILFAKYRKEIGYQLKK